ncbi:XVIPCD domain-containing protein [Lysobacter yangpyeongensis]|uniref:XVIPCD domain-containing protein n=1 Tax=Lysobacter yangpyeongensis TaxID=346182 RepID=A0ABW0SR81_9GAMM
MSADELASLADGIRGFEGWRVGETRVIRSASRQVVAEPQAPAPVPPGAAIYAEAYKHFFAEGQSYEYGRPDRPKPGRDPSRLERDLDGDGRLGVDCSAFVWRGLKNAGFDVPGESAASFTTQTLFNGTTTTAYARQHFDVVPASEARKPRGGLRQGDILMFAGSGGQHVGIFNGYDANGHIQFIGSQGSTGPKQVTVAPGGYWDGATTQIVGALRAKAEFQVRTPLHADSVRPISPEVVSSSPKGARDDEAVLGRGDKSPSVSQLQQQLHRLGYTGRDDHPLKIDGDFGTNTEHAVCAFQRAHGLHVDGDVGPATRAALAKAERAPLLSEQTHPDHALFHQAQQGLRQLPAGTFHGGREIDNVAAALALKARESGVTRIDHVLMNTRGDGVFAVQGNPLDPARHLVLVNKTQAAAQTVAHSTELMATQDNSRLHAAQTQVQLQHQEHRAGLSMVMRP